MSGLGGISAVFLSVLVCFSAEKSKDATSLSAVENVISRLQTGDGFHSKLVKKVHSGQLGSNSESKGEIYFSKGKMRMEFTQPEKTLLVFDGELAWQEQEFDDGDSKKAIVTKMKASNIKRDSAMLAALLGDKNVLKNFSVSKAEKKEDMVHFELQPKNKKISDVTMLKMNIKGRTLRAFSYVDSLENEVSFTFDDLKEEKVSKSKFHYQPPKGAEVTDL